jgi:hypothetical protein
VPFENTFETPRMVTTGRVPAGAAVAVEVGVSIRVKSSSGTGGSARAKRAP